jgi:hypothetical protein
MMTSYRGSVAIFRLREFIPDDHAPYLPHLIALRLSARKRLKVKDFDDTLPTEDVMVASNSLAKPKAQQQASKGLKWNVVIGTAGEDLLEKLVMPDHIPTIARCTGTVGKRHRWEGSDLQLARQSCGANANACKLIDSANLAAAA